MSLEERIRLRELCPLGMIQSRIARHLAKAGGSTPASRIHLPFTPSPYKQRPPGAWPFHLADLHKGSACDGRELRS